MNDAMFHLECLLVELECLVFAFCEEARKRKASEIDMLRIIARKVEVEYLGGNMNDILNKIKQVKNQCDRHEKCTNCIFHVGRYRCKVKEVVFQMFDKPNKWDIEKIERIMNEEKDFF